MHTRNTIAGILLFSYSLSCAIMPKKESIQPSFARPKKQPTQSNAVPTVHEQKIHACSTDIKKVSDSKKASRTITVKNAITLDMTKYRFWGTYYTPTKFYISVNDRAVQSDESSSCPVGENNTIEVAYHYEFKNGMVTGSKCIEFEIPAEATTVDITFSWNDKYRLMSNVGRAINAKNGTMKSTRKFL